MRVTTALVAAAVGACLVVRAAPVMATDGLLLERSNDMNTRMVPVANLIRGGDGETTTLRSSIVKQPDVLPAQVLQDGEHNHYLEVRSPSNIASKTIDFMKDLTTPLLESTERTNSGLLGLFTGKGKQKLTDDASSSSSISSIGDGSIPFRTGQSEMAKAEVKRRKAVKDAKEALKLARAQVVKKTAVYNDALAKVREIEGKLRYVRGKTKREELEEDLEYAFDDMDSAKDDLDSAKSARQQRAEALKVAEAASEGKSAPEPRPIVL